MESNPDTPIKHSFCKNHPQLPSLYFLAQHPDIRYCKNCALNVAICGRKIQRELSPQEQTRKEAISVLSVEIQNCVEVSKMNQGMFLKMEEYAQEVAAPLQNRIGQLQKAINQLTELKDSLTNLFQGQIVAEITRFKKMVELSKNHENELSKIVEGIESNLSNLIEIEDPQQFSKEEQNLKNTLNNYQQQIFHQISFEDVKLQIKQKYTQFIQTYNKATEISLQPLSGSYFPSQTTTGDNPLLPLSINNNLESSRLVEELKINLTANAQTKNKRKHPYEVPRKTTRKAAQNNQNIENYVAPARKNKNR